MILRITDGVNTVNLSTESATPDRRLFNWFPLTAYPDEERISETAQLLLLFASTETIAAEFQKLNRLFALANSELPIETDVYLEYQPKGTMPLVRSKVLRGRANLSPNTYGGYAFQTNQVTIDLFWERQNFWEDTVLRQIKLNNSGQINQNTITIENANDTTRDNYASLLTSDILGDLPTPPMIKITNTDASANRLDKIWVSLSRNGFPIYVEAEHAGYYHPSAVNVADAAYSNGAYIRYEDIGESPAILSQWDLSTVMLEATNGGFYRIMTKLAQNPSAGTWLKFSIKMFISTIWDSGWIEASDSSKVQEFGSVQLPPNLYNQSVPAPLVLQLEAKNILSEGNFLYLDFITMLSTEGFRRLRSTGYGAATNVTVVDDMIAGDLYTEGWSGGGKVGNYVAEGEPFMIYPNKLQYLWFLMLPEEAGRTADIQVFHRPRYSGL